MQLISDTEERAQMNYIRKSLHKHTRIRGKVNTNIDAEMDNNELKEKLNLEAYIM
jgi:hypothetical protein